MRKARLGGYEVYDRKDTVEGGVARMTQLDKSKSVAGVPKGASRPTLTASSEPQVGRQLVYDKCNFKFDKDVSLSNVQCIVYVTCPNLEGDDVTTKAIGDLWGRLKAGDGYMHISDASERKLNIFMRERNRTDWYAFSERELNCFYFDSGKMNTRCQYAFELAAGNANHSIDLGTGAVTRSAKAIPVMTSSQLKNEMPEAIYATSGCALNSLHIANSAESGGEAADPSTVWCSASPRCPPSLTACWCPHTASSPSGPRSAFTAEPTAGDGAAGGLTGRDPEPQTRGSISPMSPVGNMPACVEETSVEFTATAFKMGDRTVDVDDVHSIIWMSEELCSDMKAEGYYLLGKGKTSWYKLSSAGVKDFEQAVSATWLRGAYRPQAEQRKQSKIIAYERIELMNIARSYPGHPVDLGVAGANRGSEGVAGTNRESEGVEEGTVVGTAALRMVCANPVSDASVNVGQKRKSTVGLGELDSPRKAPLRANSNLPSAPRPFSRPPGAH